jgi:outer membrane protein TolC
MAAEVEIVRAESGVSDQVENIIRAENTLHRQERDLKRMLNSPDLPMDATTFITPATEPRPVYLELDSDHLVGRAMAQRMELLEAELQIRQEVLDAADQLASDWQSILAARERVVLAQRLLDVEIRQFEQGLRTSTEVLNAQNELAQAKVSEIAALTNYQIDQVDVAFATGTVLGEARVVWQPTPPPAR